MTLYYANTQEESESNAFYTETRCHDRYQAQFDYDGAIDTDDDPADVYRSIHVTKLA